MQMAECRKAMEQLWAYLENPDLYRAEAETAVRHVSLCPHCGRKMEHFIRALTIDEEDRLTCQECQVLLPDYLQAERDGQAGGARWRPVVLHLEVCPHCSEEYATLSELLELAHGERGEEPPDYPVPDLSFLRQKKDMQPEPAGIPWRLDKLGRLIVEFSIDVLRTFQGPAYQPAYAVAGLKSRSSLRTLCQFSLQEAVNDLEVTITAEEMRADPTRCTVIVTVNIPSRGGWPNLAGTEVVLKRGELEVGVQTTDAYGEAVFEEIATGDPTPLVLEITRRP